MWNRSKEEERQGKKGGVSYVRVENETEDSKRVSEAWYLREKKWLLAGRVEV